jgi:nucleoid-associated protein YgaU
MLWRLRPGRPTGTATSSDAGIVLACAWVGWVLAGYLLVAVAAGALAQLLAAVGLAANALTRLTPAGLRRLIETAVTFGVATAVFGSTTTIPAMAAVTGIAASANAPRPVPPGGALDWPGLPDPATPVVAPSHPPRTAPSAPARAIPHHPKASAQPRHHRAAVGLVTGGSSAPATPADSSTVVVQRGDSLWSIAANRLSPSASDAAIASAWHQWYAANRHVVGADPNLIYPGQRLTPPTATTQRSTR